jgi:sugar/nucleoside kinase (ribokinase family)
MYDICCVGHITLDKVITTRNSVEMAGGTAFYFSNAIQNLGLRYILVTSLASKDMGFVSDLRARGIEVRALPSRHTVYFENRYSENQDHRTQRVLQTADPFGAGSLDGLYATLFHLGPLLNGDIPVELIKILSAKGRISLDAQGFLRKVEDQQVVPLDWKDKLEALPHVHILKANESEMTVLTGQSDPRNGARILHDWGVEEVIITLGSHGSLVLRDGKLYDIPAFVPTTSVVDATGCGDTYMAGYLSRRVRGAGIRESGEFAAAMATVKIEGSGPFTGSTQDVLHLLSHRQANKVKK